MISSLENGENKPRKLPLKQRVKKNKAHKEYQKKKSRKMMDQSWSKYMDPNLNNKLYVRDLPRSLEDDISIEKFLVDEFGEFGDIYSTKIIYQKKIDQYSCFVNFKNEKDAEMAINGLKDKEFEGRVLFISMQKQHDDKKIKPVLNNLMVHSLKEDITKEEIEKEFSIFGEIWSTCVGVHKFKRPKDNNQPTIQKGYAYVRFADPDNAKTCMVNYKKHERILELFHHTLDHSEQDSIFYHVKKEQRKQKLRKNFKLLRELDPNHKNRTFLGKLKTPIQKNNQIYKGKSGLKLFNRQVKMMNIQKNKFSADYLKLLLEQKDTFKKMSKRNQEVCLFQSIIVSLSKLYPLPEITLIARLLVIKYDYSHFINMLMDEELLKENVENIKEDKETLKQYVLRKQQKSKKKYQKLLKNLTTPLEDNPDDETKPSKKERNQIQESFKSLLLDSCNY